MDQFFKSYKVAEHEISADRTYCTFNLSEPINRQTLNNHILGNIYKYENAYLYIIFLKPETEKRQIKFLKKLIEEYFGKKVEISTKAKNSIQFKSKKCIRLIKYRKDIVMYFESQPK